MPVVSWLIVAAWAGATLAIWIARWKAARERGLEGVTGFLAGMLSIIPVALTMAPPFVILAIAFSSFYPD